MKLTLGFSPCPNDTFIFDAMIHGKVDTEGLEFQPFIADVEELNQKAFAKALDVTKVSYHAFAFLLKDYALLDAGSALGNNVGPLLIAKAPMEDSAIKQARIAMPGKYTTANFLLSLAYPQARNKTEMLFSDIEDAVLAGKMDAGLIIHENRFTYQEKGLVKLKDLGEFWESATQMPIPLGGIVASRGLPAGVQRAVNRVMARSVAFAMDHPEEPKAFVRQHAQEMEEEVMYRHIGLYVNAYTRSLGIRGKEAVQRLFDIAMAKGVIPAQEVPVFVI
ncbi:MAG: 1,4-dihydroxy-6-naphthoate synthase [Lewinellaceae bacterium]|nr:1,4-dihydroxy-6-naphthoate synthase [Phaeodactylibacter sp.]MCB9040724.1 1,4-dihydroxy-6-naphthoate synthase [Lewinellaceae bacterium]